VTIALCSPICRRARECFVELIHPRREGRSSRQIGRKGKSNWRWIVGGKLCLLQNHQGLIVDWDCDTANVYDGAAFQRLVDQVAGQTVVFADTGFEKKGWHPEHLRICQRGEWNDRMIIETTLSMLTLVCHFKKVMHRVWSYFKSRVGYTMALFNILVQWQMLHHRVAVDNLSARLDPFKVFLHFRRYLAGGHNDGYVRFVEPDSTAKRVCMPH